METRYSTPQLLSTPKLLVCNDGPKGRELIRLIAGDRCQRVLYLLLIIWILNAFDLWMTMRAHSDGVLDERNPLARILLPQGAVVVFLFKLGLVAGGSYSLYKWRHRKSAEIASFFVFVAYVGVACQWKFCYDMYYLAQTGSATTPDFAQIDFFTRCLGVF